MDRDTLSFPDGAGLAPAGTHSAVCVGAHSLGLQSGYNGGEPKHKHALIFKFNADGKAYRLGRIVTDSLHPESALYKVLLTWGLAPVTAEQRKNLFRFSSLVGQSALITIVHEGENGDAQAKIVSVAKLPVGFTAPQMIESDEQPPAWVIKMQQRALDDTKEVQGN